ncbi:MAG: pirin family protein [Pseudomonadota bacterium]|nr:pirin family protein [Pseudomonadota bacterium]
MNTQAERTVAMNRRVSKIVPGTATSDGAGVRLTRYIGDPRLDRLDPFLLLDKMHSDQAGDYIAGFPEHPHRGFETVTYLLAGRMRHADSKGHEGVIEPGGVQWMTAGRGILHSEMPEQQDGLLWGYQLWINLPASEKMSEPRYQEYSPEKVPVERRDGGVEVRVIAGCTGAGSTGPVNAVSTEPVYMDVFLPEGGVFEETLAATHNAFLHVAEGGLIVDGGAPGDSTDVPSGSLAVLGPGERIVIRGRATTTRFLLIAGKPLNEPVARMGPFVMNTRAEILQAYRDFEAGTF